MRKSLLYGYMEAEMSIGNIIVGQSGGPTAVINSSLAGVFKEGKRLGADKVYGMRNGIEGLLDERYVDLDGCFKTDGEIELLKRTPASYLGSCRYKLPRFEENEKPYIKLFELFKKLDISHVFYIGGNDSMDTIKKLSEYAKTIKSDITFIGVPKTIDNDLAATDHTPGYGSAAKYIATSIKEIIRDSSIYPMESVTIVEIMGRNTGWLTAAAALAKDADCKGADLIYLSEHTFCLDKFLKQVSELKKDNGTVVVAVSEGIKGADGKFICEGNLASEEDSFGHKIISGTANYLSRFLNNELGVKARGIELSTLQRCAAHVASLCDIDEAYMAGVEAVKASQNGVSGSMISIKRTSNTPYSIKMEPYDIDKIANVERFVPNEWITGDGTGVSEEFLKYARPLIMGELLPVMEGGLPKHIIL